MEESEEEILRREKQYLIQDVAEEIEHLSRQLAVANENVQRVLARGVELETFTQQWKEFRASCKKSDQSS